MSDARRPNPANRYGRVWDHYVEQIWPGYKSSTRDDSLHWPGDEWGNSEHWSLVFARLFERARIATWVNAVEIGPGSGKYTSLVLDNSPAGVYAFDVSESFLSVCAQRCSEFVTEGRLSLNLLNGTCTGEMLAELETRGLVGKIDAVYSIDAMVHVDLQYLIGYFVEAGLMLKPGGHLILTLANACSELGFAKLLEDVDVEYGLLGDPSAFSSKFEWLSPDLTRQMLERTGYNVLFMGTGERDIEVVAELTFPNVPKYLWSRIKR